MSDEQTGSGGRSRAGEPGRLGETCDSGISGWTDGERAELLRTAERFEACAAELMGMGAELRRAVRQVAGLAERRADIGAALRDGARCGIWEAAVDGDAGRPGRRCVRAVGHLGACAWTAAELVRLVSRRPAPVVEEPGEVPSWATGVCSNCLQWVHRSTDDCLNDCRQRGFRHGGTLRPRPYPVEEYRLPDGTVVECDATATKSAIVIDYTLADGSIVVAQRVGPAVWPACEDPRRV